MFNLAKKLRELIVVGFIACTGITIGCSNEKATAAPNSTQVPEESTRH